MKTIQNEELVLKSLNPLIAVVARFDDFIVLTAIGVCVLSSSARLFTPGPKAVPSGEKLLVVISDACTKE